MFGAGGDEGSIEVLAGSGVVVPLSASSVVRLAHPTQRVTVVVDKAALDALKASDAIAMGTSTSFVGLAAGAFADTFDNGVAAVQYEADSVVEDETAPRLLRFGLDLDKAQLYLVFNEPVRTGSWDGSNVQLQSTSASGGSVVTLEQTQVVNNGTRSRVLVGLETELAHEIKKLRDLATGSGSTFLEAGVGAVVDAAMNSNAGSGVLAAEQFVADETAPRVVRAELNMTGLELVLGFDEPIAPESVNMSEIALQRLYDSGAGERVVLGQSALVTSEPATELVFEIAVSDANELKRLGIGRSAAESHVVLGAGALQDMNQQAVVPLVPGLSAREVDVFAADTASPVALHLALNMSSGHMQFTFDETVLVSSINVSHVVLQSTSDGSGVAHRLSEADTQVLGGSSDSTQVTLVLGTLELNRIKALYPLAATQGLSFVAVEPGFVTDMAAVGNAVRAVSVGAALGAGAYAGDAVRPELSGVALNLTSEELVLEFSETVRVSSVQVSGVVLVGAGGERGPVRLGRAGTRVVTEGVVNDASTRVVVRLGHGDLEAVKLDAALCTDAATTRVSLDAGSVEDMYGNGVVGVGAGEALAASLFTADHVRPELVSFNVSMDGAGLITLSFSEPVNASTFLSISISFSNTVSGNTFFVSGGGTSTLMLPVHSEAVQFCCMIL